MYKVSKQFREKPKNLEIIECNPRKAKNEFISIATTCQIPAGKFMFIVKQSWNLEKDVNKIVEMCL